MAVLLVVSLVESTAVCLVVAMVVKMDGSMVESMAVTMAAKTVVYWAVLMVVKKVAPTVLQSTGKLVVLMVESMAALKAVLLDLLKLVF